MFQPRCFEQNDLKKNLEFISEFPLATLISHSKGQFEVNHIPMIVKNVGQDYFLEGHIAKANSLFKNIKNHAQTMMVFHGPNAYISPNWYPSKKIDGKAVPTWNYAVVHVTGIIQFEENHDWIGKHLIALSEINEKKIGLDWSIQDAPQDYIQTMIKTVVGIKIKVKSIVGQTKMSQNHSVQNRQGVIQGLKHTGNYNAANWVEDPKT